ncbi:MAG: CDP-diacylglycerol--serine O-phosphatidyltransferase [Bacteroidales bacterium]|jgi:CDP-diacylglycerol--serine O-phosphatidyltransferase|nr:CDP-diacylglycerol--serine O-phosphatidyltransferase [Bacteroidales bacterium]MDD2617229.1 CDP-diacylglycerol--serine O-phosphatidyltransferase [Bacteroidales bacterium]MDD4639960.1 CDP-diacylglycerol--serine O-phosphatidyltransferase [Bacteroidales bacterium]NLB02798.1 CDP-diacylglycerol--serine O-phosphatidyltransferase [Bacteroidales bacterium]
MKLYKHIPNGITLLNVLAGCLSIVFAFEKAYLIAAALVALAAAFDFLDGFAARLFKAYSPLGKELDSLADVISFGLAPAMIVFNFYRDLSPGILNDNSLNILAYSAFLIPLFSALRLAKFNIDERQTHGFIGLPTPANALFWAFGLAALQEFDLQRTSLLLPVFVLFFSWLLVSPIPMFSLKFSRLSLKGNRLRYFFLAGCLLLILFLGWQAIALCILWYILLSLFTKADQHLQ